MHLIPHSFQYTKYFKGKIKTVATDQAINFGGFGLYALEPGRLTPKQLEAARRAIRKVIKPIGGIVRIVVKAYLPVTSKPIAVRMGRGKGKVALSVAPVESGKIIIEFSCPDPEKALLAGRQGGFRLPIKTKLVDKRWNR